MPVPAQQYRRLVLFLGILFAGLAAFFVFYTARLLYVTNGLRSLRAGGSGAWVGAVVFPLMALGTGWVSWRCFGRALRAPRD